MPKSTKKTYHHGDLRNALMDAAVPLLADKGIAGLSLRELASAAGVSHTAPYRHFRDKTALLAAIAGRGHAMIRDGIRRAAADWPDDPKRQWLEAGMNYLYFALDHPQIVQVMQSLGPRAEQLDPDCAQAAQEAIQALVGIILNGVKAGLFPGKNPEILAYTSMCTVQGLGMFATAGYLGDPYSDREQIRAMALQVAETLWEGMT